ncbi:GntR family transcriptional regulator [Cupriavidus basilensis]|uniref:GntR family transcriptional regulator n=1 Tax=Cupriavidus basilensis TaxID=68895 RepID=A0ABT6AXT9_9BURK|nr:GntR family transcriptional regulator [Cupriavidus basilensis]MDF3837441.1 GntR family transcriptional regulator [Cupriavidus basilensis]
MQSLQDRIREAIEEEIHAGKLKPGSQLDERALAEQFDSSRTPVREALLMLAAQGLVTIAPRAGIFVHQATMAELVAMFETLAEMEGVVARLATQRIGAAGRAALVSAFEQGRAYVEAADMPGYVEANRAFHDVLYHATANPYLADQIRMLRRRLAIYGRHRGLINPARMPGSFHEHGLIVAAVLEGNADAAASEMRAHISAGGKAVADLVLMAQDAYCESAGSTVAR